MAGSRISASVRKAYRAAAGLLLAVALAVTTFLLHFNLSTAGSLQLLLVVLIALRWGFLEATLVSLAAVTSLNFLFIDPVFTFSVSDPRNWISLATFEATALLVSGLSSKVQSGTAEANLQRTRTAKLYELSRAILLIEAKQSTREQLSALIRELMQVESVDLWHAHDPGPSSALEAADNDPGSAMATYQANQDSDDPTLRISRRVLRLGTTPIGGMVLRGWETDPLLADAVASLAAVAFERARAIERENRSEVARNAEQLRTAVLDGLAHGFKTPLTAIQTASSGLLAIGELSPTQAELVSIIDEEATLLGRLTTRLLQTAALEAREIRLRRARLSMLTLVQQVLDEQEEALRARVTLSPALHLAPIDVDAQLVKLALQQLLDNANKYSSVGSLIDIGISQGSLETTVTVANHGSSIPPQERER
ncbi:MAG TPA: DUF4118 domain-containing protein, partial [Acidobacteriaceae bacterium]